MTCADAEMGVGETHSVCLNSASLCNLEMGIGVTHSVFFNSVSLCSSVMGETHSVCVFEQCLLCSSDMGVVETHSVCLNSACCVIQLHRLCTGVV